MLSLRSKKTVLSLIYRPPDGCCDNFILFLETFRFKNDKNYTVILGGDLNINVSLNNHSKRDLDVIINSKSCRNVITVPTPVTSDSATLLDLFITKFDSSNSDAGVVTSMVSDYLQVFLCVKRNTIKKRAQKNFHSEDHIR